MMSEAGIFSRRAMLKCAAAGAIATSFSGRLLAEPKQPFKGLFPIGSTPVDAADKIKYDELANQVTFLRKARVPGIAWPQIASGWTVLTEPERVQGAEVMAAAAKGGDTALIVGVQSPDIAAVERYARHAEKIGANGIICIPPTSPTDGPGLLAYYQQVGKMTGLPLFVQAIGTMSVDLLVEMYETIPTMRYVKDESGEPVERVTELLRRTEGKVSDFSGRGANTLITEMERGFVGACPYVSLADVYQASWEAWHAGDHARAFQVFGAIQASNTMFSQSGVEAMIARGVFKPGTRLRAAPPAPGGSAPGRYFPARTAQEIRRVMDAYLKPYMRA